MSAGRRVGAAVLALLVPPLGAWLARSLRPGVVVNLAFLLVSHGVFWGLAALPGVALYVLVCLHALWLALMPRRSAEVSA